MTSKRRNPRPTSPSQHLGVRNKPCWCACAPRIRCTRPVEIWLTCGSTVDHMPFESTATPRTGQRTGCAEDMSAGTADTPEALAAGHLFEAADAVFHRWVGREQLR